MSEVIKKVDNAAAALIEAADDRGRSGSTLLAPIDLEEHLEAVLKWMRGPRQISVEGLGNESVPRFGLLSLILQQTPVYVYGHPALKKIAKTAFTDGTHVFVCDEMFDRLNDSVDENPTTFGIEWLLLHELMHKLFNHTRRLTHFPPDIANQATDLSINTKLVEGYPDLPPSPLLKETGLGFKPGDKDRWIHLSEETIAMELMAKRGLKKQRKVEDAGQEQGQDGQQGQKGQKGQKGQQPGEGSPGAQGQGQGQAGSGGQKGKSGKRGKGSPDAGGQSGGDKGSSATDDPLADLDDPQGGGQPGGEQGPGGQEDGQAPGKGQGKPDQDQQGAGQGGQGEDEGEDADAEPSGDWGAEGDIHYIDPATLSKVLEDAGLEAVKEKLELPDSDDIEAIGQMEEANRLRQAEAIMQAQAQMARIGGQFPGAHIVDAAGEMVKNFGKAKITWRLAMQDAFLGGSMNYSPSMEEPNELLYVDEMVGVLGMKPYMDAMLPHKSEEAVLFLVDTSGSMSNQAMKTAITEALELKTAAENAGDTAAVVYIWPCDTVLRGEPIEITEANVDEVLEKGVEMKGRGGTSIDTCINQAMTNPILADKKIRSIVYCSDLYDNPVKRPATLEERPDLKVVFLGDPETPASHVEVFAKGTDWADVYVIDEGLEVDFNKVGQDIVSPSMRKKKKMRP